jgi:hypothetical protein
VFYLDVAMFCNEFSSIFSFFASVLDTCFKYCICLHTYVVSVLSGCFKSNWVLHLPPRVLLPRLDVFSSQRQLGILYDAVAGAHRGPSEPEA